MADPQMRLGELLGKFGIMTGDSETARNAMIRRLKDVRDPLERDRIIWSLAGQTKPEIGVSRPSGSGIYRKTEEPVPMPPRQPSVPAPQPRQTRQGGLMNFLLPIIFIFFGISNIGKALDSLSKGGKTEEVIMQLLIGGMFIVFAIVGLFSKKMKQAMEKAREQAQRGGR